MNNTHMNNTHMGNTYMDNTHMDTVRKNLMTYLQPRLATEHDPAAHFAGTDGMKLATAPLPPHRSTTACVADQVATFDAIPLDEMKMVTLLDRVETKYVMHQQTLLTLLASLQPHYRVLAVDAERMSRYRTLYYDTSDFACYHSHHAGALNRYKVRSREYVDTDSSFLEVKYKTNKKRTIKYRLPTPQLINTFDRCNSCEETEAFLQNTCPYTPELLQPVLWNHYRRVTLVGKNSVERVTLDVNLRFTWQGRKAELSRLVIAEVKQGARHQHSPFIDAMRAAHVHPGGFSKYCLGVTLLYPTIKANRFKRKQRQIAKILQGPSTQGPSTMASTNFTAKQGGL